MVQRILSESGDPGLVPAWTPLAAHSAPPMSGERWTVDPLLDEELSEPLRERLRERERDLASAEAQRLRVLMHELRNQLNKAVMAFDLLSAGKAPPAGRAGQILGDSLIALRQIIERHRSALGPDASPPDSAPSTRRLP